MYAKKTFVSSVSIVVGAYFQAYVNAMRSGRDGNGFQDIFDDT